MGRTARVVVAVPIVGGLVLVGFAACRAFDSATDAAAGADSASPLDATVACGPLPANDCPLGKTCCGDLSGLWFKQGGNCVDDCRASGRVQCSGAVDCPGHVCCAQLSAGRDNVTIADCETTCAPPSLVLCRTSAECPPTDAGPKCRPANGVDPLWLNVCQ